MRHAYPMVIGLVIAIGFTLPCSAARDPSLVAHYTFDEGPGSVVKDSSGNDNHGTIIDDVQYVKNEQGKGYFLQFNSGKAYVDCGKGPSLDLTDAVSLELWFYPDTEVRKGIGGVVGKLMGSYATGYYDNKFWLFAPTGSNYGRTKPLGPASWHHLVATFDGKAMRLYVDGKLSSFHESTLEKLPSGENFYLRYPAIHDSSEPEYKCKMDDVRVYNRALSAAEIGAHFTEQARANGRYDTTWFDKPKVTLHTFPQGATIVVETNVADMHLHAPDARVQMELRPAGTDQVVARYEEAPGGEQDKNRAEEAVVRYEFHELVRPGVNYWTTNVGSLAPGPYEVVAKVTGGNGDPIGEPSSVALSLPLERPDWIKAYDGAKVLNNMVAELLRVETPQAEAEKEYTFTNPRDGWVFISSTASGQMAGSVNVFVDSEAQAAIAHEMGNEKETQEAMRHLPAGTHTLRVRCEGAARPAALVVRSMPELIVAGMGYPRAPIIPCFGYYNMEYFQRIGLLDNLNVLTERAAIPENEPYMEAWRAQGKKRITRYGMWSIWKSTPTADSIFQDWTGDRGLASPDYDGILVDEFSGWGHGGAEKYPLYSATIRRIARDPRFQGKAFYPYCMPMYRSEFGMNLLRATTESGYKWAEEKYMVEQSTEALADEYMDLRLRRNLLRYIPTFPDAATHLIYTLGFMSAPPETLNVDPQVDFKVYMEMQMHLLATDPLFFGLYGVHWYHNGYVDEEVLRWAAKLFRHYCIEGRKERLSSDPYILTHIQNPDFDEGDSGWTLQPAEPESISVQNAEGYGILQTRVRRGNDTGGDRFMLTRRSAKNPNRFSQQIKNLTSGRQYSVKMFTADYDEFKVGKSTPFQTHSINIRISGAELIPEKEFHQLFANARAGRVYGPFNRDNNLYLTYHRVVFRARSADAELTVSDWASEDEPGGPIGQPLMHSFIEVQPYLEDPSYTPPAFFRDDYVMVLRRRELDAKGEGPAQPVPATCLTRYDFDEGEGAMARNAVAGAPDAEIHGAERVKIGDGHVLRFDGQDDHVRVKDGDALNMSGTSLSIACWFRVNDADANAAALCGNYQDGVGGYMLMYAPEGITFRNGASRSAAGRNAKAADGKWHYAVGVMEDGVMILYLDGEYVPGIGIEEIVRPSPAPFEIGRSGSDRSFSGEIDEVAVYDKALSVTEIRKHFEKGAR
jgi:hypothetical protein